MSEAKSAEQLPRWDLSGIYPGLDSPEFEADLKAIQEGAQRLSNRMKELGIRRLSKPPEDPQAASAALEELLGTFEDLLLQVSTVGTYVSCLHAANSYDRDAAKRLSEAEQSRVPIMQAWTRFEAWVGSLGEAFPKVVEGSEKAKVHRLLLEEIVEQSKYLMDEPLEDLAAELQLSGGGVMWKLQNAVTSQLKMPFERDGKTEMLPMTKIRNLAYDPDERIRRRAYETELKGWESIREPVAFALNGVKGSAITLAKWRKRDGVLHEALDHNKIDRETLEALLGTIADNYEVFRRYLRKKAERLGKERLPWWDLFAPVGKADLSYTWDEARKFIVEQFGRFSPELADFASNAFEKNWIDAGPRDGKQGGAFCTSFPAKEESRILANFDGSLDQVITLAHELGHGFHNYCQKGLPLLLRGAPMVLAETASLFCETLTFDAALEAAPPEVQLVILENQLMGATQVTVDISSRFIFESEVIRRREKSELSADDFCELMLEAQKKAYGDALDENHLHPYMWLLKPHYYMAGQHFYNFPYAFGQLFVLGIYAIYLKEGDSFIPRYKELLRSTGAGKAADLAARFGIDIRSRQFWADSIALIAEKVDKYCAL